MDSSLDTAPLDSDLFAILVCPLSHKPLKLHEDRLVSTCPDTRRSYRIDDGVPIMLIDQAEELGQQAWQHVMDSPGPISGSAGPDSD